MASESSSAVLDLNDADTDSDVPSVAGDVSEIPLIMEEGHDIVVKVDAPMKQLSTLETFVTYRVRCMCARWPTPPYVRRRYNHFKALHKALSRSHPLIPAPPPPPLHSARQQLDRYSPAFVADRAIALNAFLDRIAKHPILTHSEEFKLFLSIPDEEFDKVFKSENSALNLWGLSSALYGGSNNEVKPSANAPRVKDPEFAAASDYLQSLQQKLTTLCTLTNKLYKGNNALSKEYAGMKLACSTWGMTYSACDTRCRTGAGGVALGAELCGHAHAGPGDKARAVLPFLAAYADALRHKLDQRDHMHAAVVSGSNISDDMHDKLEQSTEALRSELTSWKTATRADIKKLLMCVCARQVNKYTHTQQAWEAALARVVKPSAAHPLCNIRRTENGANTPPTESADTPSIESQSN